MDTKAAFESEIKSRGMSAMKRDGRYVDSATRFAFDCDWNCPSCGNEGPDEDGEDE